MSPEQLLYRIAKILKDLKIPYIITGGFSIAVWGKPRPENTSAFKNLATAPETLVSVELSLREPSEAEIGLLLLLLKDLWTGDLPVGGEAGIGRGRLAGREATLSDNQHKWKLRQEGDKLVVEGDDRQVLEDFVETFVQEMKQ